MILTSPLTTCRLCDSGNLVEVLPLASTPAGDHYLPAERHPETLPVLPLSLNQCLGCGHVQLGAIVNPEYLYREYIYTTSSSLGLAAHFLNYAEKTVEALSLQPGSLVVEIGSNDGTMLRAFHGLGMRVVGVDPARDIARKATQAGIPTVGEFFSTEVASQILANQGQAQLVIANNVMANVQSPRETVSAISKLLAPEGVFVFETGYLRYLAEDCVFDNIYHEHIDYYAIAPLIGFFDSLGMTLFDVHVSASKGSSIRGFVGLAAHPHRVSPTVTELVAREEILRYQFPEPYQKLKTKLQAIKADLHQILQTAKSRTESIFGFGASVGVTTVLYHFELASLVSGLIDDNPNRQGLFSPGLGLRVHSPDLMHTEKRPDWVVLLAWRYGKVVVEKHQAYQRKGGRFLEMLPRAGEIPAPPL